MKIKSLILSGLLISTGILNAQTDFRSGYIIKTIGDTIFGQIDYRGDLLMSNICKFKRDNVIIEYSPNDIKAYRFIDSKFYISREINHKNVFLEYLIKGKVNIYFMHDEKGDHYYLEKDDMKLTEIPYVEGFKYVDNKKVFYESTRHIGLLDLYMQDAPELKSRIQSVKRPKHENLIKLAEDYHNAVCEGEKCIIYEKELPLIKISIIPFFGLTKYIAYDKFINEFGGYLYLSAPRTNENIFFKTGLVYHKLSEDEENLNVYKIPIQLQYIYRAHVIQPGIGGGVNFLSIKLDDYKDLGHTLSLNAGLDYKISNKINLSTAFNSDFIPLSIVITNENINFDIISYSIIIGLRIDL